MTITSAVPGHAQAVEREQDMASPAPNDRIAALSEEPSAVSPAILSGATDVPAPIIQGHEAELMSYCTAVGADRATPTLAGAADQSLP